MQEKMQFHDCRAVECLSPAALKRLTYHLQESRNLQYQTVHYNLSSQHSPLLFLANACKHLRQMGKTSSFRSPVVLLSKRCQKGYGGMRALCPYSSILILSESQHHDNMVPTSSGHFEKISGFPIVSYDFPDLSGRVIEVRKTRRSTIQTQLAACSPVSAQPYSQ